MTGGVATLCDTFGLIAQSIKLLAIALWPREAAGHYRTRRCCNSGGRCRQASFLGHTFLLIDNLTQLDVVATYSAAGENGLVTTLDVQRIEPSAAVAHPGGTAR